MNCDGVSVYWGRMLGKLPSLIDLEYPLESDHVSDCKSWSSWTSSTNRPEVPEHDELTEKDGHDDSATTECQLGMINKRHATFLKAAPWLVTEGHQCSKTINIGQDGSMALLKAMKEQRAQDALRQSWPQEIGSCEVALRRCSTVSVTDYPHEFAFWHLWGRLHSWTRIRLKSPRCGHTCIPTEQPHPDETAEKVKWHLSC